MIEQPTEYVCEVHINSSYRMEKSSWSFKLLLPFPFPFCTFSSQERPRHIDPAVPAVGHDPLTSGNTNTENALVLSKGGPTIIKLPESFKEEDMSLQSNQSDSHIVKLPMLSKGEETSLGYMESSGQPANVRFSPPPMEIWVNNHGSRAIFLTIYLRDVPVRPVCVPSCPIQYL